MSPRLRHPVLLAGALCALAPLPAMATSYMWNGGNYSSTGFPNSLLSSDVLSVNSTTTLGSPIFNQTLGSAGLITVNSPTTYGNGITLTNSGTFALAVDGNLLAIQANWNFVNSGTVAKTGGTGTSVFNTGISFTNNGGTVRVDSGTLQFAGSSNTFNAGTTFAGAGTALISGTASFNDNLGVASGTTFNLQGNTWTGASASQPAVGATINGAVNFEGGTLNGAWTLATGSVLNVIAGTVGGTPQIAGTSFSNNGTVNVGASLLGNGVTFSNNSGGVFNIGADGSIGAIQNNWTFSNSGTLQKTGGTGTTVWNSGITFNNNGAPIVIDSGTLQWAGATNNFNGGTQFSGGGTALITGTATFRDNVGVAGGTTLNLQGGSYSGASASSATGSAVLSGVANLQGGTLHGNWTIAPNGVLNVGTGPSTSPQVAGGTVTNNGTVNIGSAFYGNGFTFSNGGSGVVNLTADTTLNVIQSNWTFNNAGLLRKSGTTGTSALATGITFANLPGGTVQVDSGTLSFITSAFSNAGTLAFGLSGPGSNGVISMNAKTALGGSFAAVLLGGYRPAVGQLFDVMNFASGYSGTFSNATYTTNGITFDGVYTNTSFELRVGSVAAVPEAPAWLMMVAGIAVMGARVIRRQRATPLR